MDDPSRQALPGLPVDRPGPVTGIHTAVAVANGKGGTGKTSVAVNVAGIAAASSYRVLVVDLDPQGDASKELGRDGAGGFGLCQAVQAPHLAKLAPIRDVKPGIDLIEGGDQLEDLDYLARNWKDTNAPAGLRFLDALGPLAPEYDLIILDCPPGQSALQEMAFTAARFVVIPARSDDFSIDGLNKVAQRFVSARRLNPDLELLGVVIFASDSRAVRRRDRAVAKLRESLGDVAPVFETFIRYSEAAADDMRERRMLATEYEQAAALAPRWWEHRGEGGRRPAGFASTADGLAGDYQRLTGEILTAMTGRLAELGLLAGAQA
jgi:cellulose biosynthesis protein BcsQ